MLRGLMLLAVLIVTAPVLGGCSQEQAAGWQNASAAWNATAMTATPPPAIMPMRMCQGIGGNMVRCW